MSQVFISYSHKDKDFVQYLAYRLSEHKINLWIDEDRIYAGEVWRQAIFDGLLASEVMILVVSQASMNSEEVGNEWQNFVDERKPIIPLVIEPLDNNKFHPPLRKLQHISSFSEQGGFDNGMIKLINSLQKFGVEFDTRSDRFIYKPYPKELDTTPVFSSLIYSLVQRVRALNHAIRLAIPYEFPDIPKNAAIYTKTLQGLIGNQIWHDGFLGDVQGNLTAIESSLSNTQLPYYIKKFFDYYREVLYSDWIRVIDLNLENGQKIPYAVSISQPDETLLNDLLNSAKEFSEEFYQRLHKVRFPPPIPLQLHTELSNAEIKLHGLALENVESNVSRQQPYSYHKVHCGYVRIDWISEPNEEEKQLAQSVVEKFIGEKFWFLSSFRLSLG